MMMNIEHLKQDEIEVEYFVRGLKNGDLAQLQEQIDLETKSSASIFFSRFRGQ